MKSRLIAILCALVCATTLARAYDRPRLVVCIVVDQLRTDYIENLRADFGSDGFNHLTSNGVYMRDVAFDVADPDRAAATAMIFTGNYPAFTGVPSATIPSPETGRDISTLPDRSPAPMLLSTVSDELAIDGASLAAIYSISTQPEQAIIMAGHSGTSAIWLDDNTGKWTSSAYYKPLPLCVSDRNRRHALANRIDTMCWRPVKEISKYSGLPAQKRYYEFRHTFPSSDREVFRRWHATPLANREVTDIAIDILRELHLGDRLDVVDMLNIGYTLEPFRDVRDGDYRLELQDAYLRLDADLSRLLNAIDESIGLDKTVIFLSSTGYYDDATTDDPQFRIPTGNFSTKRAVSLLNSYLSAKYGPGEYVSAFDGHHLFLARELPVSPSRASRDDVVADARDFMLKMSGVSDAFTINEISGSQSLRLEPYRRALDPKASGDIYVVVTPGWTLTDDLRYPAVTTPVRSGSVLTPAIIMGANLKPQVIDTKTDAVRLAPTLTQTLRLRAPNGATDKPLPLFP